MINFTYTRPQTVASAIESLRNDPSAMFIAGGTNLVDLMKKGVTAPEKLVDINRLPLAAIERKNGMIHIGALALNSAVAENELVIKYLPLLSKALKAGASPQLRNMATVGGNMMQRTRCPYFYDTVMPCNKRQPGSGCSAVQGYNRMHAIFGTSDSCIAVHPSDMCVGLAALNASVVVLGNKGERTIRFGDFHRLPGNTPQKDNNLERGELILRVQIPEQEGLMKHTAYLKVRDRQSYAFALVSVAAALDVEGGKIREARLSMGGVAHKPWRLLEAEQFLKGKEASEAIFQQAAALSMKSARGFEHNKFKLQLAPNSIVEALQTCIS